MACAPSSSVCSAFAVFHRLNFGGLIPRYASIVVHLRFSAIACLLAIAASHASPIIAQSVDGNVLERPVTLPVLKSGDSCPITVGKRGAVPRQRHVFGGDLWFGEGPVRFGLAWKASDDDEATFALERVPVEGDAHRAKTPWIAVPSYAGPILVRGRALDGSSRVLRFDATGGGPRERLELAAPRAPDPSLWSFWPSSMWVPGQGCYGVQIDTLRASEVVVFEAL
jgi:hypothetical protein